MATGNLRCPNSACQQKHLVIETEKLVCSTCGTHINVQFEIEKYERLQADARRTELRGRKRKVLIAKFHLRLFGIMAIAGLIFYQIGRAAILAFAVCVTSTLYARIRGNGLKRGWGRVLGVTPADLSHES